MHSDVGNDVLPKFDIKQYGHNQLIIAFETILRRYIYS
jgi:hypothetical protein